MMEGRRKAGEKKKRKKRAKVEGALLQKTTTCGHRFIHHLVGCSYIKRIIVVTSLHSFVYPFIPFVVFVYPFVQSHSFIYSVMKKSKRLLISSPRLTHSLTHSRRTILSASLPHLSTTLYLFPINHQTPRVQFGICAAHRCAPRTAP